MALPRCYGGPGCFDSGLKLIHSVGSGVSQLPLHNIPWEEMGRNLERNPAIGGCPSSAGL